MQINYPSEYEKEGTSGYVPFWQPPTPSDVLLDVMVPPIYAPYGTPGFYPPYTTGGVGGVMEAAPTVSAASAAGQSLSPITLVSPLPSITPVATPNVSSDAIPMPAPSTWCAVESWVNNNPGLAALVAVGLFFMLKGGGR